MRGRDAQSHPRLYLIVLFLSLRLLPAQTFVLFHQPPDLSLGLQSRLPIQLGLGLGFQSRLSIQLGLGLGFQSRPTLKLGLSSNSSRSCLSNSA